MWFEGVNAHTIVCVFVNTTIQAIATIVSRLPSIDFVHQLAQSVRAIVSVTFQTSAFCFDECVFSLLIEWQPLLWCGNMKNCAWKHAHISVVAILIFTFYLCVLFNKLNKSSCISGD